MLSIGRDGRTRAGARPLLIGLFLVVHTHTHTHTHIPLKEDKSLGHKRDNVAHPITMDELIYVVLSQAF